VSTRQNTTIRTQWPWARRASPVSDDDSRLFRAPCLIRRSVRCLRSWSLCDSSCWSRWFAPARAERDSIRWSPYDSLPHTPLSSHCSMGSPTWYTALTTEWCLLPATGIMVDVGGGRMASKARSGCTGWHTIARAGRVMVHHLGLPARRTRCLSRCVPRRGSPRNTMVRPLRSGPAAIHAPRGRLAPGPSAPSSALWSRSTPTMYANLDLLAGAAAWPAGSVPCCPVPRWLRFLGHHCFCCRLPCGLDRTGAFHRAEAPANVAVHWCHPHRRGYSRVGQTDPAGCTCRHPGPPPGSGDPCWPASNTGSDVERRVTPVRPCESGVPGPLTVSCAVHSRPPAGPPPPAEDRGSAHTTAPDEGACPAMSCLPVPDLPGPGSPRSISSRAAARSPAPDGDRASPPDARGRAGGGGAGTRHLPARPRAAGSEIGVSGLILQARR